MSEIWEGRGVLFFPRHFLYSNTRVLKIAAIYDELPKLEILKYKVRTPSRKVGCLYW